MVEQNKHIPLSQDKSVFNLQVASVHGPLQTVLE